MKKLNKEQQLELFNEVDAPQRVLNYVKKGNFLYREAQLKMLDLPNVVELVRLYVQNYSLCEEAQLKLFEITSAKEVFKVCIHRCLLCEKAELRMFEVKDAEYFVKMYIQDYSYRLYDKAHVKLFDLHNFVEIINEYIKKYPLSDEAEVKLLDYTEANDVCRIYCQKYYLGYKAQEKLYEMKMG
jgi:hypothetical protein